MLEGTSNKGLLAAEVLVPGVVLITFAVLIMVGVIYYMKRRKMVRDSEYLYCKRDYTR